MPSRRHKRQTGPMYRATKPPGLSDHPCIMVYDHDTSSRFTRQRLHPPTLRRAAAVVRNRGYIADDADSKPSRLQRTQSGVSPSSWSFHLHLYAAHTGVGCLTRRALRRHLRSKRSPFARPFEAYRPSARPRHDVSLRISNRHNRIVEGGVDIHNPLRNRSSNLLLPLRRALTGFRHESSPYALLLRSWGLLPASYSTARAFARACVRARPLSSYGQVPAVAQSSIRSSVDVTLDMIRIITTQVSFDPVPLIKHSTDADHFVIRQSIGFLLRRDAGPSKDL